MTPETTVSPVISQVAGAIIILYLLPTSYFKSMPQYLLYQSDRQNTLKQEQYL
ncbi:hypothetical protein [Pseudanabaena sp. PCC 6802]|uniref:hypothetical protein n=1 Tax=Pseudanabaena sp. PCC 6802 TaxID=118173 RepID=UPI00034788F6|nr:hypothetical protein [Pseudanabaena sp. PCC 6802]